MKKSIYFNESCLGLADNLRKYLGIKSLSSLFQFLVTDYIRKNKIVLEKKDEVK